MEQFPDDSQDISKALPLNKLKESQDSNEIEQIIKKSKETASDQASDTFSDIHSNPTPTPAIVGKHIPKQDSKLALIEEKKEATDSENYDDGFEEESDRSEAKDKVSHSLTQSGLPPTKTGKPSKLGEMLTKESPNKPFPGFNLEESNKEIDFDLSVG